MAEATPTEHDVISQALADPDIAEAYAQQLRVQVKNWKVELLTLDNERRTKKTMLAAHKAGQRLRVSGFRDLYDGQGRRMDMGANAANALNNRLAELEFSIETLEFTVRDAEKRLAAEFPDDDDPEEAQNGDIA